MLGKILQRRYEVEIIGPMFGASVWEPVQSEFPYVSVKGRSFPKFIPQIRKMVNQIKGDVIYASKPLFTSFGIGLIRKCMGKRPLVLDIDDWETPFALKYLGKGNVLHPNSYWSTLAHEKTVFLADAITVSNRFLQKNFGGTIVCHARDTGHLDPLKYDGRSRRKELGIGADKRVVTFLGTPRPHKGLEDLVQAIARLQDNRLLLMIIGLDESREAENIRNMMKRTLPDEQVLDVGIQPIRDVPKHLSLTDLVVIPQRKTVESVGQIPARVFDAMAMGKPIVATRISDLPEILDGCGWLVEPENPVQLAQAINEVFDNFDEAEEKGQRARKKCVKQYSYDAA
ncbi:MAG: glycosyltransferase, partial [Thermodesulfobacteriota bacterium]|nr:glycosyltransferase [Thermodesulfobacteriota bacterium]